jgi:protein-tyrosine phosphatase
LQKGSSHLSIIDLHTHIVPAVDDGARTISEALDILGNMRKKLESGSTVVFTPHYSSSMNKRVVYGRRGISVRFQQQMEDRYYDEMNFLTAGELMITGSSLRFMEEIRYPGTGWVLVEFSTGISWIEMLIQLKRLTKRGYAPLIAHPERYRWCRRNRNRLIGLSRMGCGTVVSARSFQFKKYAATAGKLLKDGLSHALCSDVHSLGDRILDESFKNVIEEFSAVPWQVITGEMPDLILNDSRLPELPLIPHRKSR